MPTPPAAATAAAAALAAQLVAAPADAAAAAATLATIAAPVVFARVRTSKVKQWSSPLAAAPAAAGAAADAAPTPAPLSFWLRPVSAPAPRAPDCCQGCAISVFKVSAPQEQNNWAMATDQAEQNMQPGHRSLIDFIL